jgi:hypothetical protein
LTLNRFRADGSFPKDDGFGASKDEVLQLVKDLIATLRMQDITDRISTAILNEVENNRQISCTDAGHPLDLVSDAESEEESE